MFKNRNQTNEDIVIENTVSHIIKKTGYAHSHNDRYLTSLLRKSVSYRRNKFYSTGPRAWFQELYNKFLTIS